MLAQIATALLAFASHHKLEDAKEAPTKSVYATAGTSGAGADPSKRCSEGQHEGMNMDKAACRAACIATSGCTHAIHFSDNGCQISTKGCTLVSHSYGADTDEVFEPPLCAKGTDCTDCVYKTPGGVAKSLYDASNSDQKLLAHFQSVLSFLYDTKDCKFPHFLGCEEIQNWEEHIGKILNANFNLKNPLTLQRSPAPPPPSPPSAPRIELPECAQPTWKSVPSGTKDNPAPGWSRMDGGGQGPGGTDAKGCFDSPQGYTYVTSPAQPCESGYFYNNDDGRTCDAGGCNAGEAGTCTCEHGACPAGYLRNTGGVPSGWDPWGSRRRYPYPKGDYYPSDCPCRLETRYEGYTAAEVKAAMVEAYQFAIKPSGGGASGGSASGTRVVHDPELPNKCCYNLIPRVCWDCVLGAGIF